MSQELIDINQLRLNPNISEEMLGEEISAPVEVSKPRKQVYFRAHPNAEYRLDTLLLWFEEEGKWYLPSPSMRASLGDELTIVKLVTCVDLYGDVFLWPIKMPGVDGRPNNWNESALAAADQATQRWIRLISDMKRQKYRIFAGSTDLPEPEWVDRPLQDMLQEAFADHYITSADHPVVKKLRGRK